MTTIKIEPCLDPDALSRRVPALGAAMFRALTDNPRLGVFVVTPEGLMVYMNAFAAQMIHGPGANRESYVGRHWWEYMPAAWVEERLEMVRWMEEHREPLCVRTLWRDHRHYSWMSLVEPPDGGTRPLVLIMAHRVSAWSDDGLCRPTGAREIESRYIRLDRLDGLSGRELEVLSLLGRGMCIREVAERLFRSEKTIERHRDSIHRKLNISDRAELVRIAAQAAIEAADVVRVRL